MSESWFYNCKNGQGVQGPCELSHLLRLLDQGELASHHEIRCGAIGQWVSAEDLKWFYNSKDGTGAHGPVTRVQLREMFAAEELNENTEVRKDWDGEWQRIVAVLELEDVAGDEFETFVENDDGTEFQMNVEILDQGDTEEFPADADAWFCRVSDQEQGPLPWRRIQTMTSTGRLRQDDVIRHGSDPQWQLAASFEGLFPDSSDAIPNPSAEEPPQEAEAPQSQENAPPEQETAQTESPTTDEDESADERSTNELEAWLDGDIEQQSKQKAQSTPARSGKRKGGGTSRMPPKGIGLSGKDEEVDASEESSNDTEAESPESVETDEPAPKRRLFGFGRSRTPKPKK